MSRCQELFKLLEEVEPEAPSVLIAEDYPEFLEIFRQAFVSKGYKTFLATDANTAIDIIEKRHDHIKMVVLDYDLGEGKGDDVAEVAKKYKLSPVYLISGEPSRANPDLYTKVYDKRDLVKFFKEVLGELEESSTDDLIKKVCGNYDVPKELLDRYVDCIYKLGKCRNMSLYGTLEKDRSKIHDEILQHVNIGRDDKKFNYWLAYHTEKELDKLNRKSEDGTGIGSGTSSISATDYETIKGG